MRSKRWRLAGGLLAVLAVALLAMRIDGDPVPVASNEPAAGTAAVGLPSPAASGPATGPWALVQQSSALADHREAEAAREKAWLLDPRNDAAWCERGPSAVLASLKAYQRSSDDSAHKPTGPAFDALNETTEALLQRWAAQLAARGDEESLAMSDFLIARVGGFDMQAGRNRKQREQALSSAEHLLGMARRSGQSFVMWLGASLACGDRQGGSPACKQVLARWVQVQPGSLDAMLWQLGAMPEGSSEAAVDAVLARTLAASDDSTHVQRYMGLLQSLLSEPGLPGLRQAAELKLMVSAQFSFESPYAFSFVERCREPQSTDLRRHCVAAAERVYDRDYEGTLTRMVSVAVARELGSEDQRWTARHQEMEQTRQWLRKDPGHGFDTQAMETMLTGNCQIESLRQGMLDRMKFDELGLMKLARARQGMPVAGSSAR